MEFEICVEGMMHTPLELGKWLLTIGSDRSGIGPEDWLTPPRDLRLIDLHWNIATLAKLGDFLLNCIADYAIKGVRVKGEAELYR
jgi:hypothetical protein